MPASTTHNVTNQPLDHGVLNLPLAQRYGRGGINAALSRHVAQVERTARAYGKALRAAYRADLTEARTIIAGMSAERLSALGTAHGLTVAQTRAALISRASINPECALIALRKEAAQ